MNEATIIHEVNLVIDRGFELSEDFNMPGARRLVKDVHRLFDHVNRFIYNTEVTLSLSNVNEITPKVQRYYDVLLDAQKFLQQFAEFQPKTQTGFYMFVKDITTYSNLWEH